MMDHSTEDGVPEAPLTSAAPVDQVASADAFARLAVELHDADGLGETVEAVAQFALQTLNCSHAGIALFAPDARLEIATVTDPVVAEVYGLQLDSETGPLVTALRERAAVLIRDTTREQRWPEWTAKVAALGVRSVLDAPLVTGDRQSKTIGVLGLYSPEPDAFSEDGKAVAHILARHASIAVATARHEETMAQAVDARKLVGQAMGILMERLDLDGDQAFAILKRYSQDTNTKLRDVAQQLVDTRKLPSSAPNSTPRYS